MAKQCECGNSIPQRHNSTLQSSKCPSCTLQELVIKRRGETILEKNVRKQPWNRYKKKEVTDKESESPDKGTTELQRARRLADRWFARYIKLYYSTHDKKTDAVYCKCFTCGKINSINKFDAGHFHSRSHNSVRYDPDNARPQCIKCNRFRQGMHTEFREGLIKSIGIEKVEALDRKVRTSIKANLFWYIEVAETFRLLSRPLIVKIGYDPFTDKKRKAMDVGTPIKVKSLSR